MQAADGLVTVSYTHLDVYKRQIFTSEMEDELSVVEPDLKLVLESENPRKMVIDQDTTTRLLKALYAVSYTHLDVYKRQLSLCVGDHLSADLKSR